MDRKREHFSYICQKAAAAIGATEMAAFSVDEEHGPARVENVLHIRPDDSDAETRARAIAAFEGYVRPCIEQGRTGIFEVESASGAKRAQFCLVTVAIRRTYVVGAAAFIVRLASADDGRPLLELVQAVHEGF